MIDTQHRWSGWPGAVCLDCGIEDPREICLADGDCPCADMGIANPECKVGMPPCSAPSLRERFDRWVVEVDSEAVLDHFDLALGFAAGAGAPHDEALKLAEAARLAQLYKLSTSSRQKGGQ
jgi:hypothetical protein